MPARTPPSTFLFLSSLVKEQHRAMQLPKNIRPSDQSRRGRQDVPGSGGADRFGRWRRDEADMAPPVSFVNTGINFCQLRSRPAPSRDKSLIPTEVGRSRPGNIRGSVWRRHASAAASMGGYLGRSIPAVNNARELFATVRFRTVGARKKPRFRSLLLARLTPDKMGTEASRFKGVFPSERLSGRPRPH